jgi:glucose-6-phosphate dehydrogenase assembly protein OpcA
MATSAHLEEWTGDDVSLAQIEHALSDLRRESCDDTEGPDLRTSVMTHIAWVPPEWHEAAWTTLEGMAERHPSRAILLVPGSAGDGDELAARVQVAAFALPGARVHVAAEIVELRLGAKRARSPASLVMPLLMSGLPVFCRWRGPLPFGGRQLEELTELADRLVVDSREWENVPAEYGKLAELFAGVAVSDIAWRRTVPCRVELARDWPAVGSCGVLSVTGPPADAQLLVGWLRSRLGREVQLDLTPADAVESLSVDGRELSPPPSEPMSSSELLSAELETFGRDRIYEAAVRAAAQE